MLEPRLDRVGVPLRGDERPTDAVRLGTARVVVPVAVVGDLVVVPRVNHSVLLQRPLRVLPALVGLVQRPVVVGVPGEFLVTVAVAVRQALRNPPELVFVLVREIPDGRGHVAVVAVGVRFDHLIRSEHAAGALVNKVTQMQHEVRGVLGGVPVGVEVAVLVVVAVDDGEGQLLDRPVCPRQGPTPTGVAGDATVVEVIKILLVRVEFTGQVTAHAVVVAGDAVVLDGPLVDDDVEVGVVGDGQL